MCAALPPRSSAPSETEEQILVTPLARPRDRKLRVVVNPNPNPAAAGPPRRREPLTRSAISLHPQPLEDSGSTSDTPLSPSSDRPDLSLTSPPMSPSTSDPPSPSQPSSSSPSPTPPGSPTESSSYVIFRSRSAHNLPRDRFPKESSSPDVSDPHSPLGSQVQVVTAPVDEEDHSDDETKDSKSDDSIDDKDGAISKDKVVVSIESYQRKNIELQMPPGAKPFKSSSCRNIRDSVNKDGQLSPPGYPSQVSMKPNVDESMPFATVISVNSVRRSSLRIKTTHIRTLSSTTDPSGSMQDERVDVIAKSGVLSPKSRSSRANVDSDGKYRASHHEEDDEEEEEEEGSTGTSSNSGSSRDSPRSVEKDGDDVDRVVIRPVAASGEMSPRGQAGEGFGYEEKEPKARKSRKKHGEGQQKEEKDDKKSSHRVASSASGVVVDAPHRLSKSSKHVYRSSEPDLLMTEHSETKSSGYTTPPTSELRKKEVIVQREEEEQAVDTQQKQKDKEKKSRKVRFHLFDLISPMFSLLKTSNTNKKTKEETGKGKKSSSTATTSATATTTGSKTNKKVKTAAAEQHKDESSDMSEVVDIVDMNSDTKASSVHSSEGVSGVRKSETASASTNGGAEADAEDEDGKDWSAGTSGAKSKKGGIVQTGSALVLKPATPDEETDKGSFATGSDSSTGTYLRRRDSSDAESCYSTTTMSSAVTDFCEESEMDTQTESRKEEDASEGVSDQQGPSATAEVESGTPEVSETPGNEEGEERMSESESFSESESESESDVDLPDYGPLNPFLFIQQVNMMMATATPEQLRSVFHFPEVYPALPPRRLNDTRPTLVLDLDETLVHCSLEPIVSPDIQFSVNWSGNIFVIYAYKRPHLRFFLEAVAPLFEIVLFTASQKVYADGVMDFLDPDRRLVPYRLYRDSCVNIEGNYTKDLTVLGRDITRTVIIDNSPQAFAMQYDNGIPIIPYFDSKSDSELVQLIPFLQKLAAAPDVRPLLRQRYKIFRRVEMF